MEAISINNVSKSYIKDNKKINVIENLSIKFDNNKFYVITGISGAGKTTLLNCISLLCNIDKGNILINNNDISKLNDKEISELRFNNIGIVFQQAQLFSYLNAYENVMVPLQLKVKSTFKNNTDEAKKMLDYVGLEQRYNHYPNELSGGEQQRVAIARSLINHPNIILADEPTGNLDSKNKIIVLDLFKKIAKSGKCVIMVSHDKEVLSYADIVFELKNGKLYDNYEIE